MNRAAALAEGRRMDVAVYHDRFTGYLAEHA